jgi:zinc protease
MHRVRRVERPTPWPKASRVIIALCLALMPWGGLSAQELELPSLAIDGFTLGNGLRVYVQEDHSSPSATVSMWVHAGRSADPTAGGLAHVLEHLLSLETASYPAGRAASLVGSVGGFSEATSDLDRTAFTELVPSDRLNLALAVQADRLRPPPLSGLVWDGSLQAMEQEFRTLARQPFAVEQMMADTLATRSVAYREALAWRGRIDEIAGLSPGVVAAFHAAWFVPANTVLAVSGDVDIGQVRELVEEYFGDLRRVEAPPVGAFTAVDSTTGPVRVTVEGTSRGSTLLWVSYAIPEASDSDRAALSVLASLLSGGQSSRLFRRLVQEQRLVENVAASLNFRRGPGTLIFGAVLAPDVDPDLAESLIVSIIEEVAAEGVRPAELARARIQRVSEVVAAHLTPAGKATLIQRWALFGEAWDVDREVEALLAVRELDLVRVSALSLTPEHRAVVRVESPGGEVP